MASTTAAGTDRLIDLLGDEADSLLHHHCETVPAESLHLPGPDFVDRVTNVGDRNPQVLRNLRALYDGRLGGTGYVSILPVDQGIEHSAAACFAPNPAYFDPENIVQLALEAGCNAVAPTFGVLGGCSRRYAHRIPFIVKLNHNELLTYPNRYDQIMFGSVREAWDLGAAAVGATIYFGWEQATASSRRCAPPSRRPTRWACSPCCGATCATTPSRWTGSTTAWPRISPDRPTTSG